PEDPEASAKLPDKLRELNFANPELVAPTLAQFFHFAGATEPPSDSEEWKRSMFIIVYDVIASLARERPLLYVLEDLHFADSASLELLWFVASRASRVPILLLLAQRAGPGSPEPRPVRTNFSQPVLEPLSDEEAARIDRLPPSAKETIQLASVIGQRFGDRVLREAGGPRVADSVDELIAADLVLEAAPGERREGRYRFKHAVVQEVAYNTLLVRR